MNENDRVIAVIAGGGDLPLRVIERLDLLKRKYVVLSIGGFGPPNYQSFEIGNVGKILDFIKSSNAQKILFCGNVKRPSILSLKLDSVAKKWLNHLGVRAFLGDNTLLKGIRKLLEKEGLNVISPQSILETILTPEGLLTKVHPSEMDLKDIARGIFVLNTTSRADIGQAVVVQEGIVLGIEAAEGTKKLMERCLELKLTKERGGCLIKMSKTKQDQSIDLPSIGKNTILEAEYSRLSGIALGAERTQIIDFEETIKLADEKGIFLIGMKENIF